MVLKVAGALLSRDPENSDRLQGKAIIGNLHPARRYPPGIKVGSYLPRAVPGHDGWVLHPGAADSHDYAKRCRKWGERCGVRVEVEIASDGAAVTENFWKFFKEATGGVPGQRESWRGGSQATDPCNAFGDCIHLSVGNAESLWIYIRAGNQQPGDNAARMRRLSQAMRNQMADQTLSDDLEPASESGRTVRVERPWMRDNKEEWGEASRWIQDQCERLRLILADSERQDEESPDDS